MCRIYGYLGCAFDVALLEAARDAQLPGGPLWDFVRDVLARPRLVASGFLAGPTLRRLLAEHACCGG
ncbi:hypothetical protein [Kutzneria sp. NPDC052558]|uniref:hypothetical protein n=1 Tax=Kutzneria sp. NPDC052558 TaxID=3364121 RepID=UPI0037C76D78